jgi:hypothetical protein
VSIADVSRWDGEAVKHASLGAILWRQRWLTVALEEHRRGHEASGIHDRILGPQPKKLG